MSTDLSRVDASVTHLPCIKSDDSQPSAGRSLRPRVLRNAMFLVLAQAIVTPLSVIVNAVAARSLGPADFGRLYLATTFVTFAFFFVEWGQPGTLTAKVATNRGRAGELLGSGLVWRLGAAIVVSTLLPLVCSLAGYDREFIVVLALLLTATTLLTIARACQDVFRGFERTDFAAASYVGMQLLTACVAVPTLLLVGGLRALLIAQLACAAAGAAFVLKILPRMHVPTLAVRMATLKELFLGGRVFLAFGLVMALQPLIDAGMLSRFASADAVGWHAAAQKLIGILIYPATALIVALYPTLCRLRVENMDTFRRTAADAFHLVTLAVVPVALGCALFPDLGIMIFSERSYGPAEDNLRLLALYLLLVYFTMPIGTCLAAGDRQLAWVIAQFGCVVVSLLLDPLLIPWFQTNMGNGGLGVCVATLVSEILMVSAGVYLLPKGILDKALLRKLGAALLSGLAMAVVAWLLIRLNVFVRASLALLAYVTCLWLSGAVTIAELRILRSSLSKH